MDGWKRKSHDPESRNVRLVGHVNAMSTYLETLHVCHSCRRGVAAAVSALTLMS